MSYALSPSSQGDVSNCAAAGIGLGGLVVGSLAAWLVIKLLTKTPATKEWYTLAEIRDEVRRRRR